MNLKEWSPYPYLLIILVPLVPTIGFIYNFDILFVLVALGLFPIIDKLWGVNHKDFNFTEKQIGFIEKIIAIYLVEHFFIIFLGSYLVSIKDASIFEILLYAGLTGFACAGQGFSIAHEIGHDKPKWKQLGAKFILACQCYGQFKAEHNRGHHVKAATPEDVVFSPKNKSIYSFLPKVIIGSFIDGAKLEAEALRRKGKSPWSFKNEVIQLFCISISISLLIAFVCGLKGFLFFIVQAVLSMIILEIVEYIQHYGLEREKNENGKYERMQPKHSWNSGHMFSNYLTLNLQRHSDHHANPKAVYHELISHKEAPQLPSGYPGMIAIALIPSLWYKVMNPKLEKYLDENK